MKSSETITSLTEKWAAIIEKESGHELFRVPVLHPEVIKAINNEDVIVRLENEGKKA